MSLDHIRQLQREGRLTEALALCEQISEAGSDLRALQACLYLQSGQRMVGLDTLQMLNLDTDDLSIEALVDIGGAYILLEAPQQAQVYLQRALDVCPDHHLAKMRLGLVWQQLGRFQQAVDLFETEFDQIPAGRQMPIVCNLARCYLNLGDPERSLQTLEAIEPGHTTDWEQAVPIAVDSWIALDRWDEAENVIQQAMQQGMNPSQGLLMWSTLLAAQNRHDEAEHQVRKGLRDAPEDLHLLRQLAELAEVRGHYGEARQCWLRMTEIEPENSAHWAQLALLDKTCFAQSSALQAAEKALALSEGKSTLERAQALVAMAKVCDETDRERAEDYFREALTLQPDWPNAKLGLGHLLLQWGRVEEAMALFDEVVQVAPVAGSSALISARRFPTDPQLLQLIEQWAYRPSLEGPLRSSLLFNLAAVYEHQKQYDRAFHFVQEANRASRQFLPYQADLRRQYCQQLQQYFSAAFFAQRSDFGRPETRAVFVCGMPRSGTTLVEQILGGHPDIFPAGEVGILAGVIQQLTAWEQHIGSGLEYPECILDLTREHSKGFAEKVMAELRTYDRDARYIIDKMPHNFENIGLLRLLFPNAPVIHVLREPRDVAVSNYFTNYQARFGGMGFAYDLEDIGHQLVDHQQLMAHWHQVCVKPILTVHYEDVIADPEAEARKMLAYLHLDWHDGVLNHQNLERAVKTASVWQVRQPIYQTSKEKWRRYQSYLDPLDAALQDCPETPVPMTRQPLPPGYFFRGMHALQRNQGLIAEEVFRQILLIYPQHAAATHMLGVALMQQQRYVEALPHLEDSLRRHAGHVGWYQNTRHCYLQLGCQDEARLMQQRAEQCWSFAEKLG